MAIALVVSVDPALAQADRPAKRAADRAQDVVQNAGQAVDQALYKARDARQDADRTAVQAEEEKDKEKEEGINAVTRETTAVTIPESGGISMSNVVLLALGGSALLIGAWVVAYRAAR